MLNARSIRLLRTTGAGSVVSVGALVLLGDAGLTVSMLAVATVR